MSLDTGRYQLYAALKAAGERWEDAAEAWRDQAHRDFAEDVWQPLVQRSQATLGAIDRLVHTIAHMKKECGDE